MIDAAQRRVFLHTSCRNGRGCFGGPPVGREDGGGREGGQQRRPFPHNHGLRDGHACLLLVYTAFGHMHICPAGLRTAHAEDVACKPVVGIRQWLKPLCRANTPLVGGHSRGCGVMRVACSQLKLSRCLSATAPLDPAPLDAANSPAVFAYLRQCLLSKSLLVEFGG
eukprot:364459-Chlamydomonas_euryale.AAC.2